MNSTFYSLAARGLDADLVKIEVENYQSNPGTIIVGLGDASVQESRERVRAAIKNSNYHYPRGKVVVNLAPADVRKSGPCFDLPIALGIVSLSHEIDFPEMDDALFFGELSLDGSVKHINGILGLMTIAREMGFRRVFVPAVNASEASMISGIDIYGVSTLCEIVDVLKGSKKLKKVRAGNLESYFKSSSVPIVDMSDIKGQSHCKRALEISAAGGHNILLNGSPGSGKTMMARALQGILPRMSFDEAIEATKIYSLCGLIPDGEFLIRERPFRVVHHGASGVAIIGGGSTPRPGEISLAHRGVLFLDEIAEFPSQILEMLRQPLEDRQVTISRAKGSLTYPSQFILVAAMNPCPCGYHAVPGATKVCECTIPTIKKYNSRISGPLMDRIDLNCTVSPVRFRDLRSDSTGESSSEISRRVQIARAIQERRFVKSKIYTNSEMSGRLVRKHCRVSSDISKILQYAMENSCLSARGYYKVLKVARTIADLTEEEEISTDNVLEAMQYRRNES